MNWYALKIFYRRHSAIRATLERDGVENYTPKRIVRVLRNGRMTDVEQLLDPMLMFVRSTEEYIAQLNEVLDEKAMVYRYPGTREPAPISDKEMEMFRFVVSAEDKGLEIIGPLPDDKSQKDRYRVTDGVLKGTEGSLVRIKNRTRLVVKVGDIIAVATSYIPKKYLQKVQ